MSSNKTSEETLRKMLELQWQDHFQTRMQTWKALEITALLAVAVVGIDWKVAQPLVTTVASFLLFLVAQAAISIAIRHRKVEVTKFRLITNCEKELGIGDERLVLPKPISWWAIFDLRKSNTSLFIIRALFIIQLFAIGLAILQWFPNLTP